MRSHRLKQDILNAVETAVVLAAPNRENDTFTAQKNRLQIIFFSPSLCVHWLVTELQKFGTPAQLPLSLIEMRREKACSFVIRFIVFV